MTINSAGTKTFEGNFLIWRKVGDRLKHVSVKRGVGAPRFRHPDFTSAEIEAKRLLGLFPDSVFVILQEVGCVKNRPEPVAEDTDTDDQDVAALARKSILTCGDEITTYIPEGVEPIVVKRDPSNFTTLDVFLDEEGIKEEVTEAAKAIIVGDLMHLSNELQEKAVLYSETERRLAQSKSLRQADNPEQRDDLYSWNQPGDTLYGKAATAIEFLLARSDLKKPE